MTTLNKSIAPVPTAGDFLDIVLSKTQRKTPTVVHNGMKISRLRSFYMRKVKFTQQSFEERLDQILTEFPIMDDLHPFMAALLNVLYDKNHYKLALGQLNTARHLISTVGKDYVRLLKFGDSLYRCKELKKAALGRMATIMRRQKDPLAYLEQVRQHLSRLPDIDPTTRTLLVCGYPNVGKSSFVNKVTRADVDVQPYAFTTKSLFVGHMDYNYLRWQVIDTPGVLDHPLEEMNTIEMQSITALAHLRSAVLYFMDLSEQCGFSLEAQCQLYQSIKPLFAHKPTFIVINKIDVVRLEDLAPEKRALVENLANDATVSILSLSCASEEGVMDVRNTVCDALLSARVESKEKSKRAENVANRVRVAVPAPRAGVARTPFIPAVVQQRLAEKRPAYDREDPARRPLERDLEDQNGGAGVHSVDVRKHYLLENDDWKYDVIPEISGGKNVADFIDPDIESKLAALEAEEDALEAAGFYDSDEADSDEEIITTTAQAIRARKEHIKQLNHKRKDMMQNRPIIPRPLRTQQRTIESVSAGLKRAGYDASKLEARATVLAENARAARAAADAMDVEFEEASPSTEGSRKKSIVPRGKRTTQKLAPGLRDHEQAKKAKELKELYQRGPNRMAKAGEADRYIGTKMPKYLFSGKRKSGTAHHR